ncbi:MAG: biopolymer transport protein ExbB [Verrucomicrobia bacterium]|nr:MAG: biopolymer transport protein ExbB [Verrucomicrobiota bacterium]
MYLLAACSVVGVAVILLRLLGLRRDLAVPAVLRLEVERMQSDTENPTGRLAAFLMADRSPLGRVIRVALKHLEVSRTENQDAVQVAARREMVRLEQGLFILEILIGITPLLGLLGAVSGLVKVFGAFGDAAGQSDPHVIASGIAEALTTTVVGLAIAIPCLIAYSCFVRKIETIASEMESIVSLLLSKSYQHRTWRRTTESNPAP